MTYGDKQHRLKRTFAFGEGAYGLSVRDQCLDSLLWVSTLRTVGIESMVVKRQMAEPRRWKVDLLAILAIQGIGLLSGFFIYGSFLGDPTAYYWMVPTGLVGIVSAVLAFRTHRKMTRR